MIKLDVGDRLFYFGDNFANDLGFLTIFKSSKSLQGYYDNLEDLFCKFDMFSSFAIYNKNLFSVGIIETLDINTDDMPSYNSFQDVHFDPAICPFFIDNDYSAKKLEELQNTICEVFKKYGKNGVYKMRSFASSFLLSDKTIKFPIAENTLGIELPVGPNDFNNKECEYFEFNNLGIPTKKRIMDLVETKAFSRYENENIKAAIAFIPEIIYRDGEILSDDEILEVIKSVEHSFESLTNDKLNMFDFWLSVYAVCEKYIEFLKNKDRYPIKTL